MTDGPYLAFSTGALLLVRRLSKSITRKYHVSYPLIVLIARRLDRSPHQVLNCIALLVGLILVIDPQGIARPLSQLIIFLLLFLISLDQLSTLPHEVSGEVRIDARLETRKMIDLWVTYIGLGVLEDLMTPERINNITGLYWVSKLGLMAWLYHQKSGPARKRRPNPLVFDHLVRAVKTIKKTEDPYTGGKEGKERDGIQKARIRTKSPVSRAIRANGSELSQRQPVADFVTSVQKRADSPQEDHHLRTERAAEVQKSRPALPDGTSKHSGQSSHLLESHSPRLAHGRRSLEYEEAIKDKSYQSVSKTGQGDSPSGSSAIIDDDSSASSVTSSLFAFDVPEVMA